MRTVEVTVEFIDRLPPHANALYQVPDSPPYHPNWALSSLEESWGPYRLASQNNALTTRLTIRQVASGK